MIRNDQLGYDAGKIVVATTSFIELRRNPERPYPFDYQK